MKEGEVWLYAELLLDKKSFHSYQIYKLQKSRFWEEELGIHEGRRSFSEDVNKNLKNQAFSSKYQR